MDKGAKKYSHKRGERCSVASAAPRVLWTRKKGRYYFALEESFGQSAQRKYMFEESYGQRRKEIQSYAFRLSLSERTLLSLVPCLPAGRSAVNKYKFPHYVRNDSLFGGVLGIQDFSPTGPCGLRSKYQFGGVIFCFFGVEKHMVCNWKQ